MKLPHFQLYGQNNPKVEEVIQPKLSLRAWGRLALSEKETAFKYLENAGWIERFSSEALVTIEYLNHEFLRRCPGKALHALRPLRSYEGDNSLLRKEAAQLDFQRIFTDEDSDELVLRMLSKFLSCYIDVSRYKLASESTKEDVRAKFVEEAFRRFDPLANCFNHIFEQFAVNQLVTRNGLVPRQDEKIATEVYEPTLRVLADPKWKSVSDDLAKMFADYREQNYPEAITKAHAAVQRFLQIIAGEEGKSGKGEVGKLFQEAKSAGLIPVNRFTEPLVNLIQGFIVSERATNSTAKPASKDANPSDALLMMNLVMVFLQFCLQKPN